ncbi:hypothetical protein [Gordonia humi]|uniref:DUF2267 domain-containing protein n=1 Tax=Gordonia humi TaxID=686429 RepID=A0A840F8N5_9ACTN|nr:hypothetical protein [Gordonia humi]MBB4136540.1 hypothetical protein [Gordonia humi]
MSQSNKRISTVGLLADPGAPRDVAGRVADRLARDLNRRLDGEWSIEVSEESLPIDPNGEIPLTARAPELVRRHEWSVLVYLTDLTQSRSGALLRYQLDTDEPAIVVFLPTVGCVRREAAARRLIADILAAPITQAIDDPRTELPDDRVRGLIGHLRMLSGMVHSNKPAAMGRALRGCTAVGMASGAFGVFFGSVWQIADSMSIVRLTAVTVASISMLSAWLIVRNGLWTGRTNRTPPSTVLDNASTIATVSSAVTLMHLVLLTALTALAAIVVDPGYLTSQLGHAASATDYLELGWFSASMGTVAGALGSNFDSEEVVREATYSKRWHQRRLMFDDYET